MLVRRLSNVSRAEDNAPRDHPLVYSTGLMSVARKGCCFLSFFFSIFIFDFTALYRWWSSSRMFILIDRRHLEIAPQLSQKRNRLATSSRTKSWHTSLSSNRPWRNPSLWQLWFWRNTGLEWCVYTSASSILDKNQQTFMGVVNSPSRLDNDHTYREKDIKWLHAPVRFAIEQYVEYHLKFELG